MIGKIIHHKKKKKMKTKDNCVVSLKNADNSRIFPKF